MFDNYDFLYTERLKTSWNHIFNIHIVNFNLLYKIIRKINYYVNFYNFFLYSKDRRNFKVGLILYIITLPFKYYMSHFKTCNKRNLFKSICTWNERPMHFLTVKWNWESRSYAVTFGFKAELQMTSLSSSFSFIGMEPRVQERLSWRGQRFHWFCYV